MPRSRAIRILGMAVASATVPLLRPKPAAARYSRVLTRSCHEAHCPLGHPPNPNDPYTLLCKCNEKPTGSPVEPLMCNQICCDPCVHECECLPGAVRCKPKSGVRGLTRRSSAREGSCGTLCCGPDEYCANPARSKCCPDNPRKDYCSATDRGSGKYVDVCCTPGECCFNNGPLQAGTPKATCCPQDRCCKGECCGPQQTCVKGVCKCKDPKKKKCGKDCCSTGKDNEQPCCGNDVDKICCAVGTTCCGIDCCQPKTQTNCCRTGKGSRCCPKERECCGKQCCDSREGETCHRGGQEPQCCAPDRVFLGLCCPRPLVATRNGCCPPNRPNCCDAQDCPAPKPGQHFPNICVNGKCGAL
jgi:hypothetical protein